MKTRRDVIQRAYERLGVVRPGAAVPGNLYTSADDALLDKLLEINEDVNLDFDPLADEIPEERMFRCTRMLMEMVKPMVGQQENPQLLEFIESKFKASVIGESDHIEDPVTNY